MKTGWVFDIASGVVSILNQNGRWHKKLSRGILEALLALDAEMGILRRCLLHHPIKLRQRRTKRLRLLNRCQMVGGTARTVEH